MRPCKNSGEKEIKVLSPKSMLHVITLLVLTLTLSTSKALETTDKRTVIKLEASERNLVLSEMRSFLSGVQKIVSGVSKQDMKLIALNAKKLGLVAAQNVPAPLTKKLPDGFKKLAFDTHVKFDEIARDAADFEDPGHTLSQVATLMQNCVSCHAIYQLQTNK